jgi:hypothetical protein
MTTDLDYTEQAILDKLAETVLGSTPMPFDLELDLDSPALKNDAVARCTGAWEKAYLKKMASSKNPFSAADSGAKAFRQNMPPLVGRNNILDHIACISYGMLIGVIEEKASGKYLYAAQIALTGAEKPTPYNRFV